MMQTIPVRLRAMTPSQESDRAGRAIDCSPAMNDRDAVLDFWFPAGVGADLDTHRQYWEWRMRGGAHAAIVERFSQVTERAARGELEAWAGTPRGRLALVVALDQF